MNRRFFAFAALLLLISPPLFAEYNRVVFKTSDNVPLVAFYTPPQKGKPVVLMLHGLASTKEEWMPLASALEKQGWGSFAYDQRGHGASSLTRDENGSPNGYKYFGPPGRGTPWEKMIDDVGSAIRFLQTGGIDKNKVYLAGASIGANICLRFAALTKSTPPVVLLSPGLNYQEFRTDDVMGQVKAPVLIVASEPDQYAFASAQRLKQIRPATTFWSDVKPGHGVQMFEPALLERIIKWLSQPK